jgi:hypothetical protein
MRPSNGTFRQDAKIVLQNEAGDWFHRRAGNGARGSMVAGMNRLQLFVSRKGINSFIPNDLVERIANPIPFITPTGVRAHGFEATLLADVCEAVLKAREAGRTALVAIWSDGARRHAHRRR